MKTNKMYYLMTRLSELANNVAFSEKNGFEYDKEEFKEDLRTLMEKIEKELEGAV